MRAHLVWITKYRYRVLTGPVALRCRDLIRQICTANDTTIISGNVAPNHVHLLVSYPTNLSASKRYWGQHLWARGFFAVSTGNVTTEMIENYIKNHKDEEDEFKITRS